MQKEDIDNHKIVYSHDYDLVMASHSSHAAFTVTGKSPLSILNSFDLAELWASQIYSTDVVIISSPQLDSLCFLDKNSHIIIVATFHSNGNVELW